MYDSENFQVINRNQDPTYRSTAWRETIHYNVPPVKKRKSKNYPTRSVLQCSSFQTTSAVSWFCVIFSFINYLFFCRELNDIFKKWYSLLSHNWLWRKHVSKIKKKFTYLCNLKVTPKEVVLGCHFWTLFSPSKHYLRVILFIIQGQLYLHIDETQIFFLLLSYHTSQTQVSE